MHAAVITVMVLCTLGMGLLFSMVGIKYVDLRRRQAVSSTAKESFDARVERLTILAMSIILVSFACEIYLATHR